VRSFQVHSVYLHKRREDRGQLPGCPAGMLSLSLGNPWRTSIYREQAAEIGDPQRSSLPVLVFLVSIHPLPNALQFSNSPSSQDTEGMFGGMCLSVYNAS
jgi:hypothetical protein